MNPSPSTQARSSTLLSILIPAYNAPAGVQRCLVQLGDLLARSDVEVLIGDDSTQDESAAAIRRLCESFAPTTYSRNEPPLGAAQNWNALLRRATGTYCVVLHHDEFPRDSTVFAAVLQEIEQPTPPDVIVLGCLIQSRPVARLRRHCPWSFVRRVIESEQHYLFRRNLIGAPSAVIVRRDLYQPYDERLRWLVDVDFYYRLFRSTPRVKCLQGSDIVSALHPTASITASMRPELKSVRRVELALISNKYASDPKILWLAGTSATQRALRFFEAAAWLSFRLTQRLLATLNDGATVEPIVKRG